MKKVRRIIAGVVLCILLLGIYFSNQSNILSANILGSIQFGRISENVLVFEQAGFAVDNKNDVVTLRYKAENPTIEIQLWDNEASASPLIYRTHISRNPLGKGISSWLVLYADVYQEGQGYMKIWIACWSSMDGHRKLVALLRELFGALN